MFQSRLVGGMRTRSSGVSRTGLRGGGGGGGGGGGVEDAKTVVHIDFVQQCRL